MKIGVLSDTHGVFSDEFREFFKDCDELWHAGDFGGGFKTAAEIQSFKPTVGVVGNCDEWNLRFDYPVYRFFEREGKSILITHIGGYPGHYDVRARRMIETAHPDIFVCGHSHILRVMEDDSFTGLSGNNLIVMNPGAAGIQGMHVLRTALRFTLTVKGITHLEVLNLNR